MKKLTAIVAATMIGVAMCSPAWTAEEGVKKAGQAGAEGGIRLKGIDGKMYAPLEVEGTKAAAVIFFVSPYCPTSNTFGPEMKAISAEYGKAFAFYFVHSDPSVTEADMGQHAVLMEIEAPVVADSEQQLAKELGAKITPEAVVVDASGNTVYQGRINDLYLGPTKRQREATTQDLRDALEALRDGKPVATPRTEAVGCEIGGLE